MSESITIELDQMPKPGHFATWFENRNAFNEGMKALNLFIGSDGRVELSFISRTGRALRGGFAIKKEDFEQMCRRFLETV